MPAAGLSPFCLKQVHCAGWLETGSTSRVTRFLIHIDAQDAQDFSRGGRIVVLGIRIASGKAFELESRFAEMDDPSHLKSTRDHRRSQPLVQQPPVLIILCIDVE